jgi:hypothetical protein
MGKPFLHNQGDATVAHQPTHLVWPGFTAVELAFSGERNQLLGREWASPGSASGARPSLLAIYRQS